MRTRLPIACWLLLCPLIIQPASGQAAESRAVESTITHVTVYPEWAYVTRVAEAALPAGASRLTLDNLPAWIDGESIRVSLKGAPGITLQGASTQTTYLTRSTEEQVNQAEDAVTALQDRIEDLNNRLAVLEEEKQYLKGLRVFSAEATPKDAAVREVDVDEMAAVQSHLKTQMMQNIEAITAVRREVRGLQPELSAAKKKWNDLRGRVRLEQKQIVIELTAEAATEAVLEVGYLISGASWYPAYDARTDSRTGQVTLTARAVVQQSTGEDWSDATFVLSTIQPYLTREKPELKPWYIGADIDLNAALSNTNSGGSNSIYESGRFGPNAGAARLSKIQSKQLEFNEFDQQAAFAYGKVMSNRDNLIRVIRQVEERGTTVEFTVAGKHAVTADGKATDMPLGVATLETTRHYSAVPAVSRSTYVTGKLRNTGSFPVLPGEVRIYTDGSFVAKSELPFVAQNEKFELFLGLEERIKVTRELDYTRSSSATWSNKKRLDAAYVIEVRNFLDRPINIEISDQIPVSQLKAVSVKLEEAGPDPASTEKGILAWSVDLAAGKSLPIRYAYRVEYPPNSQVTAFEAVEQQIRAK